MELTALDAYKELCEIAGYAGSKWAQIKELEIQNRDMYESLRAHKDTKVVTNNGTECLITVTPYGKIKIHLFLGRA